MYKKNWSFQSRWFVLCCFLLPFPYDAYVISFQSANKNRLEHLDSNQNLLSFLCYAVVSTVFFTCAPSFLNHKCIGFLSICMYCRLSTWIQQPYSISSSIPNKKNEDLVLKSQNHTPQNDEIKLITRPFSICNDRVFALRLNHLSHASAYHNIYAHIHPLGWSIQIRELELLDGSSNSNYPKNQSDKIRPSG